MNLRARLTQAITRSGSQVVEDDPPSDFQIKLVTGSYSDETCEMILATEHTEAEESVILIATAFLSSDELMQAFIHALPEHDGYGHVVMLEYFKELEHLRTPATSYEESQLENLIDTATEYMRHTSASSLPSTTDDEHRLIALVTVHPELTEILAGHIGARSLDADLLDSFYDNASPSLSKGIL